MDMADNGRRRTLWDYPRRIEANTPRGPLIYMDTRRKKNTHRQVRGS